MRKSKFTEEQIIGIAKESGGDVATLLRRRCIGRARSGWPADGPLQPRPHPSVRLPPPAKADIARADVRRVDGVRRNPQVVTGLLRSLARNVGTPASIASLQSDVNGAEGNPKADTVSSYLDVLARLMVTEDLPAWAPSLRSRTRLRAASVRHFVDPSLAVAAMGADADRLLGDLKWFGFLFENLVIRGLRVAAQSIGARVYAYRDESGLEVDAVVERPDGRWAGFEIKLGLREVDSPAAQLLRLRDRVDIAAAGEPLALVVVTGTGYAYVRKDGVSVDPIGALGA